MSERRRTFISADCMLILIAGALIKNYIRLAYRSDQHLIWRRIPFCAHRIRFSSSFLAAVEPFNQRETFSQSCNFPPSRSQLFISVTI
jgi:hypothetical protein